MKMSVLTKISRLFARKKNLNLEIFPEDIFLVAYPKSGITWLRFLIGNYMSGNECDFSNSHFLIPDIHYNLEYCRSLKSPRIIKSHMPYTKRYPRVVYLVRDGRDVAVSFFYYLKKYKQIDQDKSFSEFLPEFNKGPIDRFGSWSRHAESWMKHSGPNLLIVRYEDLLENTEAELKKILTFCRFDIDDARVTTAIEYSSMDKMRKSELDEQDKNELFSNSDKSISFVRSGKSGNWSEYFNERELSEFYQRHGRSLKSLGYFHERNI